MPTPNFVSRPLEVTGVFGAAGVVGSAASDGSGNLYLLDNNGDFFGINMDTGGSLLSGKSTTISLSLPRAHCVMVGLGSAIVASGANAAGGVIVELSSYYSTSFAPWNLQLRNAGTAKHQQICFNSAASSACYVANSAGKVGFFSAVTASAMMVTVPGYSAETFNCVIPFSSSSHFLLGGASGYVVEVDATGSVVGSVFVQPPASSCVVTAVGSSILTTYPVSSLAVYGDNVLISTGAGLTYNYLWSSKTLVETLPMGTCGNGLSSGGVAFNTYPNYNSSGMIWYTRFGSTASSNNTYLNVGQITPRGKFRRLGNVKLASKEAASCIGFDPSVNVVWVNRNNGTTKILEVLRTPPYSVTTVPTRTQNPPGTDVAARIVRICDPGLGRAFIYSDGNVSAGQQSLPANATGEYYEISLISGQTLWDWRKFNC